MQHYFIETTHSLNDYFNFDAIVAGEKLSFRSCDNIFSKDEVDIGSRTLIDSVITKVQPQGKGLDFGCGYGVVGITLMKKCPVVIDFADVNGTAIELTRTNLLTNGIKKAGDLIKTNDFENITSSYDFIVTNPPIKTGKKLLLSIMDNCKSHLNINGTLTLVIRKDKGEDSLRKYLISLFGNCEVIERNQGFYILHSIKMA